MKKLIILMLLLLVLGLYFYTDSTKEVINLAGQYVKDFISKVN
jgi:hypothetical protein